MAKTYAKIKWLLQHLITSECDDLETFVDTISSGLNSQSASFQKFIDDKTKDMDENQKREFLDWYSNDAFGLYERYPKVLWQSIFISFYALFENEMNDLCRRLRDVGPATKKKIDHAKGEVLLPAQPCLEQYDITLATKSHEWKRLIVYLGIRNLIVHNRGRLRGPADAESNRIRAFVKKRKNISLNHHDEMVITKEFCLEVVATIRNHLVRTIEAIPDKLLGV